MKPPILMPEQALAAALANLDTARANERLVDVSFGTFAERTDTPGGAYHSLRFGREIGNTRTSEHTYGDHRDADRETVIRAWRRTFHPTPEELAAQRQDDGS